MFKKVVPFKNGFAIRRYHIILGKEYWDEDGFWWGSIKHKWITVFPTREEAEKTLSWL